MTIFDALLSFGGLLLAVFSFLMGKLYSQSEKVLAEKRRVYEELLRSFPVPNDAYEEWSPELELERLSQFRKEFGPFLLYATSSVLLAASIYQEKFEQVDHELHPDSEALHPSFKELAKAHNDLILEMRRDALGWSFFAYKGKSRLPPDALENAKRSGLN